MTLVKGRIGNIFFNGLHQGWEAILGLKAESSIGRHLPSMQIAKCACGNGVGVAKMPPVVLVTHAPTH